MSQEPHTHDWHYNDAETDIVIGQGRKYRAIRYCKTDGCHHVEEIELKPKE